MFIADSGQPRRWPDVSGVEWVTAAPQQFAAVANLARIESLRVCRKPENEHTAKVAHKYERDDSIPAWCGWHAFRRGLATNLHDVGADDKTIQKILRHSSVQVTQQAYIKNTGQADS